ncbi:MAG: lipopolysaccharide core heptose(II) kinase RfaY, partial [Fusobacteriaceae bacterium]
LAIEKRKYGLIEESYVLTEYIDGKIIKKFTDFSDNEKKELVKTLEKIHQSEIYHGDANHGNFVFTNNGIRVIDTLGKKESWSNYKRNYDFITLDDCIKDIEKFHEYKKNELSYWLALGVKKYKKRFK